MCAMSVQDILVEKSNGENETEPYVPIMETRVESDERCKLFCLYFICVMIWMNVSFYNQ